MFKKIIQCVLYLCVYLSLVSTAHAENFRIYSVIVPWSAGSPSDVLFRGIEPTLNARLEQHHIRLITENAPGAGGSIGLFKLINNKETTTFGFFSPFFAILRNIRPENPYNYDSVNYLSFAGYNRMVILSGKYSSIDELCSKNKTLILGSSAVGSMSHLAGYYFAQKYLKCTEILNVPYKSTSDAYPDLKAGRVDILSDFDITANNYVASGYFNSITEIKDTDLLSWHVFVSNKVDNPDIEIVRREFDALKKDKKFVKDIESKFSISKFSETKDITWLINEFGVYKKITESIPQSAK